MNDAKSASRIAVATGVPVAAITHVPSRDDHYARGKALREKLPRKNQGMWKAHDKRADPIALLRASDADRIQELVPDPLRPDAAIALHLLSRVGGDHGLRPVAHRPIPASRCRPAAIAIWQISAASPRPSATSSSTSTISTRPCRRHGNGTSSGSSPRSSWPAARSACPTPRRAIVRSPAPQPTASA